MRINYYEDYHEEKLLSLNDESLWDEIRILDHVLLNTDFFFGEEKPIMMKLTQTN